MMRRISLLIALVALVASGCADPDTGAAETSSSPSIVVSTQQPSTTTSTDVTETSTTTSPPTTTTSTVATTTTTQPEPTAEDSLSDFFNEAQLLDHEIASAAQVFNNGFDPEAGTISPQAVDAIGALSAEELFRSIPPGIPREPRAAALAVYADMASRIASLAGAARYVGYNEGVDAAYQCLRNGRNSKARLAQHLENLRMRAAEYPPIEIKPRNSIEGGVLAVHREIIRLMNWGCDSCGGANYTNPVEVNWKARIITDSSGLDPDWELPFTATYDGDRWIIETPAC
ncbi:hypothetical protein ACFLQ7_00650 [Actinomycetota bacterium]